LQKWEYCCVLREHEDSNVRTYLPGELICCESLSTAARRDTKRKRRRVARPNPITRLERVLTRRPKMLSVPRTGSLTRHDEEEKCKS